MPETTYPIALVNMFNGAVHGHKAGCADLTRGPSVRLHADDPWTFEVTSKNAAWLEYNSDFLPECDRHDECDEAASRCYNAYDIDWKPCADHVPTFEPAEET